MWRVLNSRQERTCPTLSKQYTDEFKAMVVELYKSGKPASEIMREYGLTSSTFYKWTKADLSRILCKLKLDMSGYSLAI